jgi:signal transduction histidine kinase
MQIEKDITTFLLSDSAILPELIAVFPESIILDTEFRIRAAGRWVEETLGYTSTDLFHRTLDVFQLGLENTIREKLVAGYFEEGDFILLSKSKREVMTGISGFYLGIFADVNGYIILRLIHSGAGKGYEPHYALDEDFDEFVYNAAHSLRGPLATIKGLINLARVSDQQKELAYVLDQLGIFSEKLDDKLHKLILFAESDTLHHGLTPVISKYTLEQRLRKMIQEASCENPVAFEFHCHVSSEYHLRIGQFNSLLVSFMAFILSLERTETPQLKVKVLLSKPVADIVIEMNGFRMNEEHASILRDIDYGYASLLNHTELIKCYIAMKNSWKMEGKVDLKFLSDTDQVILISLPSGPNE